MALLPVKDAQARILEAVTRPTEWESVPLHLARGRVLARDVVALRTQPPFAASAMDGYAVRAADLTPGAQLRVIGETAAGHRFAGIVSAGEAVRIFTGAPVPEGADTILMQEHADNVGGAVITVLQTEAMGRHIRVAGLDFTEGQTLLEAGMALDAARLSLAASMGHPALPVFRRPRIALLATGDELVNPGEPCGPDQIISSNGYGLAALIAEAGGDPIDLGIAPDDARALDERLEAAAASGADAVVTLGGASVGDHDLVQRALANRGMTLDFWKIAMRPGKPLMFGALGHQLVVGVPGNPVAALVCGIMFVQPMVRALAGHAANVLPALTPVRLGCDLPPNDMREDYLRARLEITADGGLVATPLAPQDSSMLSRLAAAQALLLRPAHAPPGRAGDVAQAILLRAPD